MARPQTLSSSQILWVGPASGASPSSSIKELYNVTDFGFTITNETQPVSVFGQKAPQLRDAINTPTVEITYSYNISNADNENHMGLVTNGQSGIFTDLLNGTKDDKNYYLSIAPYGSQNIGLAGTAVQVIGFGNANITSYGVNATVGDYLKASVTLQGLNVKGYTDGDSEFTPSIDRTTGLENSSTTFTLPIASGNAGYNRNNIIKPGDIYVDLSAATGFMQNLSQVCLTSFSIDTNLGDNPLQCLGNRFAKARVFDDNIEYTASLEFNATDLITGSLQQFLCQTGVSNISVVCRQPACVGATGTSQLVYNLRGLYFNSEAYNGSVGSDSATITLDYVGSIGAATDLNNNLTLSGIVTS